MAVKYSHCGDIEGRQVPPEPADVKAMAEMSKMDTVDYTEVMRKSVDSMILSAMMVVCLSFVAIFSVPMALRSQIGYGDGEEAMNGLGFRVFVVLDAVTFFSSLGVVAVLILVQAKGVVDIDMLVMCGRVVYVATGCAGLAFMAAASTFSRRLW